MRRVKVKDREGVFIVIGKDITGKTYKVQREGTSETFYVKPDLIEFIDDENDNKEKIRFIGITISERGVIITVLDENKKILNWYKFKIDKPIANGVKIRKDGLYLPDGSKYDGAVGLIDLKEESGGLLVEFAGKLRKYPLTQEIFESVMILFNHEDIMDDVVEIIKSYEKEGKDEQ